MHLDFNLPLSWDLDDPEAHNDAMPTINTADRVLMEIIRAASELSDRERSLALLLIQTIGAWSGIQALSSPAAA